MLEYYYSLVLTQRDPLITTEKSIEPNSVNNRLTHWQAMSQSMIPPDFNLEIMHIFTEYSKDSSLSGSYQISIVLFQIFSKEKLQLKR